MSWNRLAIRGGKFFLRRNIHFTKNDKYASLRYKAATVSSFYNQAEIDKAASEPSIRLTPTTIMYAGNSSDGLHILRSAQYLQKELPVRLAHIISGMRNLPFIVGCNPIILSIHEQYIHSFQILTDFPTIKTVEDEEQYSQLLRRLLDEHKTVISQLAKGFKECSKYIKDEEIIKKYLDYNLTARLSIRMLVTHHLHLKDKVKDHVGIVNIDMNLKKIIEKWATFVSMISHEKFGVCPNIRISGHINAHFPYLEMPLDYIIPELLKNATRAVIEAHPGSKSSKLPPIIVTLASNDVDFAVKISDRGGGIPPKKLKKIMQYHFTDAERSTDAQIDQSGNLLDSIVDTMNMTTSGPMYGYGFGLPTSRAYTEYLGGSLSIESLPGLGTDVYLRLKHFSSKDDPNPFRV
ncbi:branched-chain alpha-ketoacid dehydrogenase kinase [Lepeophtheirus salmonis]|nr:3-methyl-2-oxobutanoate dehydrogenase [lipoamide] kinase, mitochondrial-like [Lepeophtheirus salmonis]XP_040578664.1 3-methyl-2-oxobutanoate dehydrogenase [lipoamide] kinase, mitochondrial-like [Lepeophtheirus salmonis]